MTFVLNLSYSYTVQENSVYLFPLILYLSKILLYKKSYYLTLFISQIFIIFFSEKSKKDYLQIKKKELFLSIK